MTYNPSIPQANDLISNSQGDILTNFTQLNNQFTIDHVPFYTGSGNGTGRHKQVGFSANQTTPGFANGVSVLYANTDGTNSQLFFNNAGADIQITSVSSTVPAIVAGPPSHGVTFLPGDFLIQWGTISATSVTFPVAFKMGGVAPAVTFAPTGTSSSSIPTLGTVDRTHFTVSSNVTGMCWMAIGQR